MAKTTTEACKKKGIQQFETWKGARFVGFYAAFPIDKNVRRTEILDAVLRLEAPLSFTTIKFGLLSNGIRTSRFAESMLSGVLKSLETGKADWLQVYSVRPDEDWVREKETQVHLSWASSIIELKRPPSPIDKRFANTGSIIVTYPISRFQSDSESPFQAKLLSLVRNETLQDRLYWSFIHEGFRPKRPASVGEDDVFQETREKFPLTSFDSDLGISHFFKEFVKGAFWANLLNPFHVKRLGGLQRIKDERPCTVIEEIGDGHVLLQVSPSPLPADHERPVADYQRLRRFLKPILLETPEDRTKFQMDVLGSWRPPGVDEDWNAIPPRTPKG